MKYIGNFRDKEDNLHTITITTKVGASAKTMVLCTDPFVVEVEGDGSTIFKPCKYSSATIRVLTQGASDYMFDVFQSTAQDVSVVLTDEGGNVEWTGYVTPNIYDMGFVSDKEELEIECLDALSTLQYFTYKEVGIKPRTQSFLSILSNMFRDYTPYKYMYFPKVYENISLENLKISEQNFFDSDGDDDWTMQKVLEEICLYLNVTCIAEGESLYFLHYSSLGKFKYYKHNIESGATSEVNISDTYSIIGDSYSETGAKISMLPSFNRISVTSKINEYENLLPDVFEEAYLTNANGNWNNIKSYIVDKDLMAYFEGTSARYKFLLNKYYKTYYYNKSTGAAVTMDSAKSYQDLQNYVGATLLQASFEKYENPSMDTFFSSNPNSDLTDYILIHQHDTGAGKLVLSTKSTEIPETYLGRNTKIVIKGSIRCMDRANWMYIPSDYGNKKDDFERKNLYLECKLKWGNYYFHNYQITSTAYGTSERYVRSGWWDTNAGTFRLFFNASSTDHINNKEFNVLDTSGDSGNEGMDSGYIIPIPEAATTLGSIPEFSIYTRGRVDSSYRLDCIWLKDFSIGLAVNKDSNIKDDDWETDTEYTNIINDSYVEEGEDIECNVNTWDNKAPTYSVVMQSGAGGTTYLDEVKNLASGETHRFEEHIIYDYVTQYKQPSILLDVSLKERLKPYCIVYVPFLSSTKKFIVDSYTRNYYTCSNDIRLVEKWNL